MLSFLKAKLEGGNQMLKTWQRLQNQLSGATEQRSNYITPEPEAMALVWAPERNPWEIFSQAWGK